MIDDALAWYLAPWRRVARAPFNSAVGLASLPGGILSLSGMVDSAGGVLAPLQSMMGAGTQDPAALQQNIDSLQKMQDGLMGAATGTAAAASGVPWGDWVDNGIWLALIPLVMMRLRDMGWTGRWVLMFTILAYMGTVMGVGADVVGGHPFGEAQDYAGYLAMGLWAWMCLGKTHEAPRAVADYPDPFAPGPFAPKAAPPNVTAADKSGKVGDDDAYTP